MMMTKEQIQDEIAVKKALVDRLKIAVVEEEQAQAEKKRAIRAAEDELREMVSMTMTTYSMIRVNEESLAFLYRDFFEVLAEKKEGQS